MVVLGRIVAPFGVQGWVRVHPFADDPLEWASIPQWWVAADADAKEEDWRQVGLRQARIHGDGLIAKLVCADDRGSAEALNGLYVGVPRESMPKPATDEYYWSDLVGLDVVNLQGVSLGRVSGLIETGANDVLKVNEGDKERLLPFVAAVVRNVDMGAGRISVDWDADW
jgi:16S rRNA processing protein RimM